MKNSLEPTANSELSHLAFNCDPSHIASTVLLLPFLSLEIFRGCFDTVAHEFHAEGFFTGVTGHWENKSLTLIRTGIGSVRVIDAMLALRSCQVSRVAFAGTCGGLAPSMHLGDMVIPNSSYIIRDIESVLEQQYSKPDPLLLLPEGPIALTHYLKLRNHTVHGGTVASIPSVFLLQDKLAQFLQDAAISGIDLETAYLHQVCQHLGLSPQFLLTVSDLPIVQPLRSLSPEQKRKTRDIHVGHVKQLIPYLLQSQG